MSLRLSRRLFLLQSILLTVSACKSAQKTSDHLLIGVINYDQEEKSTKRYQRFNRYLSSVLRAHVEIEPTFNERKALERIQSQAWSLVFAPPGVAAIAITNFQYLPLFPIQEDMTNHRSILVVRNNSPISELRQLEGKAIALGQVGSATGYYFPIYNLYGLTLAEVLLAPTPKTILEWVAQEKVIAGALSTKEFNLYSPQFSPTEFRIIYTDSHLAPPSTILLAPKVNRTYQSRIIQVMKDAPPDLVQEAGYIPNAAVPSYEYMISVMERVRAIATQLDNKPVQLF
ncbi:phosphate/phosphite/phosphonate ABC transporter substrate-binding protein [Nostoc sp. UHCC 0251]|uniref:phosphate/phosphite/phosphonate ABC transporter substrate-binding protein n=1 Tax=Nostoc sp. UHCC 0251 TaxID=3110240 RepID=UPI002B1FDC57|nr:PhnD/SsuA/transferrin family substrate-binding protein [Nostoc sp. UHCC 0251]MEA5626529.1 PhnD/SsuA/transferrin family substrate-binding protein [Nostoc sp. UHCC 0251]